MKGVKPWHDPDAAKELFLGKTHPEHGHGVGLRLNFASERLFKPKSNDSMQNVLSCFSHKFFI